MENYFKLDVIDMPHFKHEPDAFKVHGKKLRQKMCSELNNFEKTEELSPELMCQSIQTFVQSV